MLKLILAALMIFVQSSAAGTILLRDNFKNMDNWRPLNFPKIKRHTEYRIARNGANDSMLEATAIASASGLILKKTFSAYKYPLIRWRWKVSNIYKHGDATLKNGDDYPARIYLIFKYDPQKSGFFEKALYKSAKLIYGEYPPVAALNYIWANRKHSNRLLVSKYTSRSIMIPVEQGAEFAGQWRTEEVNILDDYRAAFRKAPPETVTLAIMSDADNTGDSATSDFDFIEVGSE